MFSAILTAPPVITRPDTQALVDREIGDVIADHYEYGWWVFVPGDLEDLAPGYFGNLSESFKKILRKAQKLDCQWIKLDCDGLEHDDLDKHDWE